MGSSSSFPKILTLNVGGRKYSTSLSTLTKFPDSMLAAMFSGRIPSNMDEKGRYFIDRDGDLFKHILNFLRTDQLFIPANVDMKELFLEAEFYMIEPLMKILHERMQIKDSEPTLADKVCGASLRFWDSYAFDTFSKYKTEIIQQLEKQILAKLWDFFEAKIYLQIQTGKTPSALQVDVIQTSEGGHFQIVIPIRYVSQTLAALWSALWQAEGFESSYRC